VRAQECKQRHVTTIAGPQAQAIIDMYEEHVCFSIVDKSVLGMPIVEIWADVDED
jgi:hypothetical protein